MRTQKKILNLLAITIILSTIISTSSTKAVWDNLLLTDSSHDVMHIINDTYIEQGEYHAEIDIVQLQVTNSTAVLTLDAKPTVTSRDYLYEINIFWNSEHNFGFTDDSINYTHCILGLKDGIFYDIVRMNTVINNASGFTNYFEEHENVTTSTLTKITWDIASQYNDFEKNPAEIEAIFVSTLYYVTDNQEGDTEYWSDWLPDSANPISTTAAASLICLCPISGFLVIMILRRKKAQ